MGDFFCSGRSQAHAQAPDIVWQVVRTTGTWLPNKFNLNQICGFPSQNFNKINLELLIYYSYICILKQIKMKSKKKHTLLKGEGANQHTLYGEFQIGEETDFMEVEVVKESVLKHEQPNGSFGEHQALKIDEGSWVMGKQVEYNPFNQKITRVWD